MLTQDETKLIAQGYGHMVDPGYGRIETVPEVIKTLEVSLERARREQRISKVWNEANPGADAIISFLEPTIKNLTMRTGV